ncbi:MAG: D-alanine--D-alanine ligase family protein [Erysipelotrichaceae bacterium]
MKIRVAVMYGGKSVEHEISILSALQVMHALDKNKYQVIPIYIAKDHCMYQGDALWDIDTYQDEDRIANKVTNINLIKKGNMVMLQPTKHSIHKKQIIDLVLPIIHGTNGEDGTIQGYLEMLDLPYCGSSIIGAAINQDKVIMKQVMKQQGIPTVDFFYTTAYESETSYLKKADKLGYPLIMKPANLGSSIGIHIAKNQAELKDKIKDSFLYDEKVMIEKVVEHLREVNISVMGNMIHSECSLMEEVIKSKDILSYEDKYQNSQTSKGMLSTKRILPANFDQETQTKIKNLALQSFHELCSDGVVRIDFLIDDETKNIYVNEINTIPGSLAFYLWKDSGYLFHELLDRVIELGLDKMRRKKQKIMSYDTNILNIQKGKKLS